MISTKRKTYTQNGIEYNEPEIPQGFTVVDEYTPHSCPWDSYGSRHLRECSNVMKEAGIEHAALAINPRFHISPMPHQCLACILCFIGRDSQPVHPRHHVVSKPHAAIRA